MNKFISVVIVIFTVFYQRINGHATNRQGWCDIVGADVHYSEQISKCFVENSTIIGTAFSKSNFYFSSFEQANCTNCKIEDSEIKDNTKILGDSTLKRVNITDSYVSDSHILSATLYGATEVRNFTGRTINMKSEASKLVGSEYTHRVYMDSGRVCDSEIGKLELHRGSVSNTNVETVEIDIGIFCSGTIVDLEMRNGTLSNSKITEASIKDGIVSGSEFENLEVKMAHIVNTRVKIGKFWHAYILGSKIGEFSVDGHPEGNSHNCRVNNSRIEESDVNCVVAKSAVNGRFVEGPAFIKETKRPINFPSDPRNKLYTCPDCES